MFYISFRKHRDEKKENNLLALIIKMEGREGRYQIPVPRLNLALIPVPRLIFAKIPVTKSTVAIQQKFRVFGVYNGVIFIDLLDF